MTSQPPNVSYSSYMINQFRAFAKYIKEDRPYRPVCTEMEGFLNLAIGGSSILVSMPMVVTDSYFETRLAKRHLTLGAEAVGQGLKKFLPGAVTAAAAYYLLS